jgi:hypothetical protein
VRVPYRVIDEVHHIKVIAANVLQHLHCGTETAQPERAIDVPRMSLRHFRTR